METPDTSRDPMQLSRGKVTHYFSVVDGEEDATVVDGLVLAQTSCPCADLLDEEDAHQGHLVADIRCDDEHSDDPGDVNGGSDRCPTDDHDVRPQATPDRSSPSPLSSPLPPHTESRTEDEATDQQQQQQPRHDDQQQHRTSCIPIPTRGYAMVMYVMAGEFRDAMTRQVGMELEYLEEHRAGASCYRPHNYVSQIATTDGAVFVGAGPVYTSCNNPYALSREVVYGETFNGTRFWGEKVGFDRVRNVSACCPIVLPGEPVLLPYRMHLDGEATLGAWVSRHWNGRLTDMVRPWHLFWVDVGKRCEPYVAIVHGREILFKHVRTEDVRTCVRLFPWVFWASDSTRTQLQTYRIPDVGADHVEIRPWNGSPRLVPWCHTELMSILRAIGAVSFAVTSFTTNELEAYVPPTNRTDGHDVAHAAADAATTTPTEASADCDSGTTDGISWRSARVSKKLKRTVYSPRPAQLYVWSWLCKKIQEPGSWEVKVAGDDARRTSFNVLKEDEPCTVPRSVLFDAARLYKEQETRLNRWKGFKNEAALTKFINAQFRFDHTCFRMVCSTGTKNPDCYRFASKKHLRGFLGGTSANDATPPPPPPPPPVT